MSETEISADEFIAYCAVIYGTSDDAEKKHIHSCVKDIFEALKRCGGPAPIALAMVLKSIVLDAADEGGLPMQQEIIGNAKAN